MTQNTRIRITPAPIQVARGEQVTSDVILVSTPRLRQFAVECGIPEVELRTKVRAKTALLGHPLTHELLLECARLAKFCIKPLPRPDNRDELDLWYAAIEATRELGEQVIAPLVGAADSLIGVVPKSVIFDPHLPNSDVSQVKVSKATLTLEPEDRIASLQTPGTTVSAAYTDALDELASIDIEPEFARNRTEDIEGSAEEGTNTYLGNASIYGSEETDLQKYRDARNLGLRLDCEMTTSALRAWATTELRALGRTPAQLRFLLGILRDAAGADISRVKRYRIIHRGVLIGTTNALRIEHAPRVAMPLPQTLEELATALPGTARDPQLWISEGRREHVLVSGELLLEAERHVGKRGLPAGDVRDQAVAERTLALVVAELKAVRPTLEEYRTLGETRRSTHLEALQRGRAADRSGASATQRTDRATIVAGLLSAPTPTSRPRARR